METNKFFRTVEKSCLSDNIAHQIEFAIHEDPLADFFSDEVGHS